MNNKVFLVQLNKEAAQFSARELCAFGFNVDFEAEQPDRALNYVTRRLPFAVVIDLSTSLADQCLDLGQKIRQLLPSLQLPLVFLGGRSELVEKVKKELPGAVLTTAENLRQVLMRLSLAKNSPTNPSIAQRSVLAKAA